MTKKDFVSMIEFILGMSIHEKQVIKVMDELDRNGSLDSKKRNQLIGLILHKILDEWQEDSSL